MNKLITLKTLTEFKEKLMDSITSGSATNQNDIWLRDMVYANNYWALLVDENGNAIADENSNTILGNWSYVEKG